MLFNIKQYFLNRKSKQNTKTAGNHFNTVKSVTRKQSSTIKCLSQKSFKRNIELKKIASLKYATIK